MSITAVQVFVRATLEELFPMAQVWCDWYQPERLPSHIADINVRPIRFARDTFFGGPPTAVESWKGNLEFVAEIKGSLRNYGSLNEYRLANNVACILESTPFMPSAARRAVIDDVERLVIDVEGADDPVPRPFPMNAMVTQIEFVTDMSSERYERPVALVYFHISPLNLTLDDIVINPQNSNPRDYGQFEQAFVEHEGGLPDPFAVEYLHATERR